MDEEPSLWRVTGINNVKCDWRKTASCEVSRSEGSNLLCSFWFSAELWLDKTREGVRKGGKKSLSEHLLLHILLNPFTGGGVSVPLSRRLLSDQMSQSEVRSRQRSDGSVSVSAWSWRLRWETVVVQEKQTQACCFCFIDQITGSLSLR